MPRYLLDTNICIYVHRKRPDLVLRRFLELKPGEAAISVITYGELFFGACKSSKTSEVTEQLRAFAEIVPVLPIPQPAGEKYGQIRAHLAHSGHMIGNNDLWIAAHALTDRLTLVTNNEREFRRVRGLKIQNWTV